MPSSDNIPNGFIDNNSASGRWNIQNFQIQQSLAKMNTSTLVEIVSCTNEGGLSPVGFVNVIPMVNQVDAAGNAIPHTTIFNVPYSRIQGGTDAIIIDPKAGDIGIALFASRDISKVKSTKKSGNPGSGRTFSYSDAMYIGGLLNGTPSQYVRFSADGVEINSPVEVKAVVGDNSIVLDTTSCTTTIGSNTVLVDSTQWKATIAGQTLLLDSSGLWHNGVSIGSTHQHLDITNTTVFTGTPVV